MHVIIIVACKAGAAATRSMSKDDASSQKLLSVKNGTTGDEWLEACKAPAAS